MEEQLNKKIFFDSPYHYFPYQEKERKILRIRPKEVDSDPSSFFFTKTEFEKFESESIQKIIIEKTFKYTLKILANIFIILTIFIIRK